MKLELYINPQTRNKLEERDLCDYSQWVSGSDNRIPVWNSRVPVFLNLVDISGKDEYLDEVQSPYFNEASELTPLLHNRRIKCTMALIEKLNLQGARLLDIACGDGIITKAIKAKFNKYEVFGLDNSFTAIKNAVSEIPIEYMVADAFEVPLRDAIIDVVVCNNFWEHVTNPVCLAKEANRVLKMGGYYIISTPSRYNFDNVWRVLKGKPVALQNPRFHLTEYSIGQMKELLSKAGFEITDVISEALPITQGSWKQIMRYKLLKPLLKHFLKIVGSHHNLETTVFISAKKIR